MVSYNVSRGANTIGLAVCLCVAFVFVAMRTGARWFKIRRLPLHMEDIFMYLALTSFTIMCALYLAAIPTFYNVTAIMQGHMKPYPGLGEDLVVMLKEFFVVQFFFWLTLWAVKWSLLFLFKRLTHGLPLYNKVWWAILIFSILTFIGCCISNFTSCSSMRAWFTAEECSTPRDARAKAISLWFSLAADLSTDLLIMAVPIRVLWNLKISRVEKISIGIVFAVGLVTMATAIIRSVSLNSSSSAGQVSTTWLMLWAAIEGVVSIIVGCLPSFAVFIRGRVTASRPPHEGSSGTNPSSYRLRAQTREQVGSLQSRDTASDKSMVERGIVVTRTWSQRWQKAQTRRERETQPQHELEITSAQP